MKKPGSNTPKDILKIPEPTKPPTPAELEQAYIEGYNDQYDNRKILNIVTDKSTGVKSLVIELSPEEFAKLKQQTSIHLHNPDDGPGKHYLTGESGKTREVRFVKSEDMSPAKNWSAAERKRRAAEAIENSTSKDR